jgi:hypothetical protein
MALRMRHPGVGPAPAGFLCPRENMLAPETVRAVNLTDKNAIFRIGRSLGGETARVPSVQGLI